ncbi:MAG: SDR family oxidoreductase, partial [Phycisphaerae bacterium]
DEPDNCLNRRVLVATDLPPAEPGEWRLAPGHEVLVTDDGAGLSAAIVSQLIRAGGSARVVRPGFLLEEDAAPVGGLILVAPPEPCGAAWWNVSTEDRLKAAFADARSAAGRLVRAGAAGGALLATVCRMDGAFGLVGGGFDPAQGGLAGLAKTAAREWEQVTCRAIDVALGWEDVEAAAQAVVRELRAAGPVEVGLDVDARRGLELAPAHVVPGRPAVSEGDVVVVSGGARGVTAEAAAALARRYRPTLVLLGRTPLPDEEPAWLAGLEDEREIKEAIRANEFAGTKPKPRALRDAFKRHLARREIRHNLARIAAAGSRVVYRSVDVRDGEAVRRVLKEIAAEFGPVRGLVHGAGAIQDARIQNKTPEQFALVLDTKVRGLRSLLDAVSPEALKHIVLFSSVSGRCGNPGQIDYAMANEVLNKAARRLAVRLPDCRAVSLNWGPWDGGMVRPALKREFERLGIELIPMDAGGAAVAEELADLSDGSVEVVLGATLPMSAEAGPTSAARANPPEPASPATSRALAFERRLDLETHPFLRAHVLDGSPVLPVAMMIEWLSHAAMHVQPGLLFQGLDDLRVFKGVVLDAAAARALRFYTARPRRSGDVFDVDVELRSRAAGGDEVLHARATVVLSSRPAAAPRFEVPASLARRPYERGVDRAYAEVLFHGELLRGIARVDGFSETGMAATLRLSSSPDRWMAEPLRSDWLTDPLALDCGFQLAILWCDAELDAPSLPSALRRYRQYRPAFPAEDLALFLEVRERRRHRAVGDLTYVASDGSAVARIEGYECTVEPSLREAFRRGPGLDGSA